MNVIFQKPIDSYNAFIGRQALISKIYARIGAGRPQSVSIVGDLKVGKSSLLWYLAHEKTKKALLNKPDEYIYLFVPCRTEEPLTLESFTRTVFEISRQYTDPGSQKEYSPVLYNYFKNLVENLHKQNKKIILFLDDFNLVTLNTAFPLEFFSFLRSLANNYNLAYITTSYEDLQKLCVSKDIEESPFFNIFTNMSLRGFDPEEINILFKTDGKDNDDRIGSGQDFLVDLVGTLPFPLQLGRHHLHKIKKDSDPLDTVNKEEFESFLADELYDYHQQLWSGLDESYRQILIRMACGLKIDSAQHYILRDLSKKNYVINHESEIKISSQLFHNYIYQTHGEPVNSQAKNNFLRQPFRLIFQIFNRFKISKRLQ